MADFADASDLESFLGLTFDASDQARAESLLDLAVGVIRDEIQQTVTSGTTTETLDGDGRTEVLVSEIPVTDVTQVRELDDNDDWETLTADDDYRWTDDGRLIRWPGEAVSERARYWLPGPHHWPDKPRSVEVSYDHGYSTVPGAVKQVCLAVAARWWVNPEGVVQRRRGDASTSFAPSGSEAAGLTKADLRKLAKFRGWR